MLFSTSQAWGFFSSLKREDSSHLLDVKYFICVLWHWGLPHHLVVRCFARLFWPWGLPHHLDVRSSFSYGRSSHFFSVGYYCFDLSSLRRELIDFCCYLRGFNASAASHVFFSIDFSLTVVVNVWALSGPFSPSCWLICVLLSVANVLVMMFKFMFYAPQLWGMFSPAAMWYDPACPQHWVQCPSPRCDRSNVPWVSFLSIGVRHDLGRSMGLQWLVAHRCFWEPKSS